VQENTGIKYIQLSAIYKMVKIRKYFPINAPSYNIIETVYINENQVRKTYRQVLLIVLSPHFAIASCR
jgi:hypothetical protein